MLTELPILRVMKRIRYTEEPVRKSKSLLKVTERVYACSKPDCNKTFKNKRAYQSHLKRPCNRPPRFKCGYCEYRSWRVSNTRRHVHSQHKNCDVIFVDTDNDPCPNQCSKKSRSKCLYCSFKNTQMSKLKKRNRLKKERNLDE